MLSEVSCYGSWFHGKNVCDQYGMTWNGRTPYRYAVGAIGSHFWRDAFRGEGILLRVCHWIGDAGGAPPLDAGIIHLADDEEIGERLAAHGVAVSAVIRHTPIYWTQMPSAPSGNAVLFYQAQSGVHDISLAGRVANATDREIVILRGMPVIERDIKDIFRRCSHYLRVVNGPDGFSHLAAEMIMHGGAVVTNKVRPFQHYAVTFDEVIDGLSRPQPHGAARYYRALTSPMRLVNFWESLINEHR